MRIVNPVVTVIFYGSVDTTIDSAYIDFDIEKDLTENENTCSLEIANLNSDFQQKIKIAAQEKAPIEVYLTKGGAEGNKPELAFYGEIESTESEDTFPGSMTYIECSSQRQNHRTFYTEASYLAGTRISEILTDLIEVIGLPRGNSFALPQDQIAVGESFEGPAFKILERYAHDLGKYCYIMDGKLFLTDVFNPPRLSTTLITDNMLLGKPVPVVRNDRSLIQKKYNNETGLRIPFENEAKGGKRRKRKRKRSGRGKSDEKKDFIEYEAVDETIRGMDFKVYASAGIKPDDIVQHNEDIFRVLNVSHTGNNYGGDFGSLIRTVEYNHYLVYVPELQIKERQR